MAVDTIATIKAFFETGDTPTQSNFEDLIDTLNISLPSDYRMVAGVIRNSGSGWDIIDDADHTPINMDSVTSDSVSITIDYTSLGATEVVSLVATPDETYAGLYDFGSSVGVGSSSVLIKERQKRKIVSLITHSGSGSFTKSGSDVSAVSYNTGTGLLTITHTAVNGVDPRITCLPSAAANDTVFVPASFSIGSTSSTFRLYKADGTGQQTLANPEMSRGYFMRDFETNGLTQVAVNPANVSDASGNVWIIGVFKV